MPCFNFTWIHNVVDRCPYYITIRRDTILYTKDLIINQTSPFIEKHIKNCKLMPRKFYGMRYRVINPLNNKKIPIKIQSSDCRCWSKLKNAVILVFNTLKKKCRSNSFTKFCKNLYTWTFWSYLKSHHEQIIIIIAYLYWCISDKHLLNNDSRYCF